MIRKLKVFFIGHTPIKKTQYKNLLVKQYPQQSKNLLNRKKSSNMEDLEKLTDSKSDELRDYYENPSYLCLLNSNNENRKPEAVSTPSQTQEIIYLKVKVDGKDIETPHLLKSSFTLRALVSAYDIDKRCGVSIKIAIEAVYRVIKKTTKREETLERLEREILSIV